MLESTSQQGRRNEMCVALCAELNAPVKSRATVAREQANWGSRKDMFDQCIWGWCQVGLPLHAPATRHGLAPKTRLLGGPHMRLIAFLIYRPITL